MVRKSLLPSPGPAATPELLRSLGLPTAPVIFDYGTIAKNNSLYNTLSIFDVWMAGQVMGTTLATYGDRKVSGQEEVTNTKAQLLYSVIDRNPEIYHVVPRKNVRSRMNICFRVSGGDEQVEKSWLNGAESRGLTGLRGHRSVGGIRISNCMPVKGTLNRFNLAVGPLRHGGTANPPPSADNSITPEGAQKLAEYIEEFAAGRKG